MHSSDIIPLSRAARSGKAANRVGGTTHGTPAAHQSNLGRSAAAFVKMNATQIRRDCFLARNGWRVIVATLVALTVTVMASNALEAFTYS